MSNNLVNVLSGTNSFELFWKSEVYRNMRNLYSGLSILRMLMCFEVVLCHFWYDNSYPIILKPFLYLKNIAVPIFMIMSFFLTYSKFIHYDKEYVKRRICKLTWPLIGWAIIYWISYTFIDLCFHTELVNGIDDMIWQIITGHSPNLNASMWYQTVLILITILFLLIFKNFSPKHGIICISLLLVGALCAQYSGINYSSFSGLRYELMYPLGRVCEMIPYAVIGFLLSHFHVYEKIKRYKIHTIVLATIITISQSIIPVLTISENYGYAGFSLICIAVSIFTIVMLIPFNCLPIVIQKIIEKISKYTLGIYCMHRLIGSLILPIMKYLGLSTDSFYVCCLIYIVCYICSFLLAQIPSKLITQLVE